MQIITVSKVLLMQLEKLIVCCVNPFTALLIAEMVNYFMAII